MWHIWMDRWCTTSSPGWVLVGQPGWLSTVGGRGCLLDRWCSSFIGLWSSHCDGDGAGWRKETMSHVVTTEPKLACEITILNTCDLTVPQNLNFFHSAPLTYPHKNPNPWQGLGFCEGQKILTSTLTLLTLTLIPLRVCKPLNITTVTCRILHVCQMQLICRLWINGFVTPQKYTCPLGGYFFL